MIVSIIGINCSEFADINAAANVIADDKINFYEKKNNGLLGALVYELFTEK